MLDRSEIFTRAHQIAKANKAYFQFESYRDLFAAALVEAYKEAKAEEAKAEEAQLTSELTICTEQLIKAQDMNDYAAAESYKLQRSELQRRLREIRSERLAS